MNTLKSNHGLSAIEIMSSMAIITILASLLLGGIGASYEKARQAECINNQHQLIDAVLLYALDEEQFPDDLAALTDRYFHKGTEKIGSDPISFTQSLYAGTIATYYANQSEILHCPKVDGTVFDSPPVYSYGFNAFIKNINYSKVSNPSRVVVIADSDQEEIFSPIDIVNRHIYGSIASFADGHVEWVVDYFPYITDPVSEIESLIEFNFTNPIVSDNGFTWKYIGLGDNGDGTSTFTFHLTNDNNKALSYNAFGLPDGVSATWPDTTYSGTVNDYNVENTTENPFHSIKFETIGEGVKDGAFDVFRFTITNVDIALMTSMQLEAKGGKIIGGGNFEIE